MAVSISESRELLRYSWMISLSLSHILSFYFSKTISPKLFRKKNYFERKTKIIQSAFLGLNGFLPCSFAKAKDIEEEEVVVCNSSSSFVVPLLETSVAQHVLVEDTMDDDKQFLVEVIFRCSWYNWAFEAFKISFYFTSTLFLEGHQATHHL